MQIAPRYDGRPVLSVDVVDEGEHPMVRQRRRLETALAALGEDEWQAPSRCDNWTVQDVVSHLTSTNSFWAVSIGAGLAGKPTRFLASFDPVATPAQIVEGARGESVARTLAGFVESNDAVAAAIDKMTGADWDVLAEAPPGHLPIRLVADHTLWDGWIHERDILLPLGHTPSVADHEVRRCLRYAAGLGRAFALSQGDTDQRSMVLEAIDPDDCVVVVADGDVVRVHGGPAPDGSRRVRSDAVAMVEHLSMRDPGVPPAADLAWLTAGLAEVFDQAASG